MQSPLLCLNAIQLLPMGSHLLHLLGDDKDIIKDKTLIQVLKSDALFFANLQTLVPFRLLIIQKMKNMRWILRYDGRHLVHLNETSPFHVWLLNAEGDIQEICYEGDKLPPLHANNFQHVPKSVPLWQLLGLEESKPDPINFNETMDFLVKYQKEDSIHVDFLLAPGCGRKLHVWNKCNNATNRIVAFTTKSYGIAFRHLEKRPRRGRKPKEPLAEPNVYQPPIINERQANRSSAISVKLIGLNLAHALGCISSDTLRHISTQMGQCCVSLWVEMDDKCVARYATVFADTIILQTEIKSESSWCKVFNAIFQQQVIFQNKKEVLLKPILEALQSFSQQTRSLYKVCEMQLQSCIRFLKVVLFSPNDSALHAIKLPLANYLKNLHGKKFRGITLNSDAKNDLILMKYKDVHFFNLNMYLKENVTPEDALPMPLLRSDIKDLKNQHKSHASNMTLLRQCKERGRTIAPALVKRWQSVGHFFLTQFQWDIFSTYSVSLSQQSFQAVWNKYTQKAGIFHQGLEKMKPAYEETLRSFCRGGFSYSVRDTINCDEPIHGDYGEPAQTLIEVDLTSSYGFGASEMKTPKGFCNAFSKTDNATLKSCEPVSRHHTFEFLSVYFTLWRLGEDGVTIQTTYSNYHQSGVFYIGHYPIDLVVITVEGKVIMFQFDGQFAHGCREGCKPLISYVRGKSKEHLECDSQKRDDFITHWVEQVNAAHQNRASYHVKTNCHHPEYSISALRRVFDKIPILSSVIEDYPNKKIITKEDIVNCNDNMTYLAVLEGFIPQQMGQFGPLKPLLQFKDKRWARYSSTQEELLLTKDFVDWLIEEYNFQITFVHKVYFYKRCHVLNSVFKELTDLRMSPAISPSVKQLVKNVINFSAGYFGLNLNKRSYARHSLISNIPKKYNIFRHQLHPLESSEKHDFYIKTFYSKMTVNYGMSKSPLPLFVSILEYGKLRMSQILCFFDSFLDPFKYRHLYSNVDNIVMSLAAPSLEDAVVEPLKSLYEKETERYFQPNTAGHLKFEYVIPRDQEWKFVSAMPMNYVILAKESSVQKNCALNNLKNEYAYQCSLMMLTKQRLSVEQQRRVNKIANTETKTVTLVFNK